MRKTRWPAVSAAGIDPLRVLLLFMIALCSLTVCPNRVWAEWETFEYGDGLADIGVLSIVEDSSGRLWFGHARAMRGGVSCYDGSSWTTYTTEVWPDGVNVHAIVQDGSGDFWFGTFRYGVSRYDGTEWTTYTTADGLADSVVYSIIEDSSGDLWFGTWHGGVSRYDGTTWTTYTTADGLADNAVGAILEDSSGGIWFGTLGGGISRFDSSGWTTYTTADGLADDTVYAIFEDSTGSLWFGTRYGGVSRYDGTTWITYTTADGLADDFVRAITQDDCGNLWFGTGGFSSGVSRFDGVHWDTYTYEEGLVDGQVAAVTKDACGNLWFGTSYGLSRYDQVSWATFTTVDGLANDHVQAILEDSSGDLWFACGSSGVSRYDREDWTTYTTADGLVDDSVQAIVERRSGGLWFGTAGGVSHYNGYGWIAYTTADGLAHDYVRAVVEDDSGRLWFGTDGGVSRFDGLAWTTFTTADGLVDDTVWAMIEDGSGDLWFGTAYGVSRYDGVGWTTYTTADGLVSNEVTAIAEDSSGCLWFGTDGHGVSRFDGAGWVTYTDETGLADDDIRAIFEDASGSLWFATDGGGVGRYQDGAWSTYGPQDGLASDRVLAIAEDRSGGLWLGTEGSGVSVHEPDRVAPQTLIPTGPPAVTSSRAQNIAFLPVIDVDWPITYSYSFDESPWSEWAPVNVWTEGGLPDGEHTFRVKARDRYGNTDPTPAAAAFEVDATPPAPVIERPAFGEAVRDSVRIQGTVADPRFEEYVIEVRSVHSTTWDVVAGSDSLVTRQGRGVPDGGALLGVWDSTLVADGGYVLRLSVTDTLGLTGAASTQVIVDNHAPWSWETAPMMVTAMYGGDVHTTNREVHLYFPPRALPYDAVVSVEPSEDGSVPDTLASGAQLVYAGHQISWGGAELSKQATLEMRLQSWPSEGDRGEVFALYAPVHGRGVDEEWERLGGTVSIDPATISAPITRGGTYAIFKDFGGPGPGGGVSGLSFTPRVFSPSGNFANTEVAISFILGSSGPVTVKVYNRAGRLVEEVTSDQRMNAGANVVRWDGRDRDGAEVPDGLYLVTVEALGETQVSSLGVVR